MQLTDHELTAASSAVAALAIIGGYLGVRSANQNALKVAREERSARRKDDQGAYKRALYAKFLSSLSSLRASAVAADVAKNDPEMSEQRRSELVEQHKDARLTIDALLGDLVLIAPDIVHLCTMLILNPPPELRKILVADIPGVTTQDVKIYDVAVVILEFYMKQDLDA